MPEPSRPIPVVITAAEEKALRSRADKAKRTLAEDVRKKLSLPPPRKVGRPKMVKKAAKRKGGAK